MAIAHTDCRFLPALSYPVSSSEINDVAIKEEDEVKHVLCGPIKREYRIMLETGEIVSYNASILPNYYDAPAALLNAINKQLRGDAESVYDERSKACSVNLQFGISVKLSEYFSSLLRFAPTHLLEESAKSASEIKMQPPISNVLVYTDIVEPSFFGSGMYPILKMAPFVYEENKRKVYYSFNTVQYFKLSQCEITSIGVQLFGDRGRKLPLRAGGKTALTLHFRKMYTKDVPAIYGARDFVLYESPIYKRGSGFFANLVRYAVPLFKRASPYLKKTAVTAAKRIGRNISEGDSIGQAIKRGAKVTGKEILTGSAGSRITRKRICTRDIFSAK